jgi:hypothetical protein
MVRISLNVREMSCLKVLLARWKAGERKTPQPLLDQAQSEHDKERCKDKAFVYVFIVLHNHRFEKISFVAFLKPAGMGLVSTPYEAFSELLSCPSEHSASPCLESQPICTSRLLTYPSFNHWCSRSNGEC